MTTEKASKVGLGVSNVGTPGDYVVANEYGSRFKHSTELKITKEGLLTLADNAALGDGHLIYTFPAGHILIHEVIMSMSITSADGTDIADAAAEFALGTVIATGAVGTTAGFEDIYGPIVLTDTAGTVQVGSGAGDFDILAAAAHTCHFNVAGTWINHAIGDNDVDLDATVVLNWSVLNA